MPRKSGIALKEPPCFNTIRAWSSDRRLGGKSRLWLTAYGLGGGGSGPRSDQGRHTAASYFVLKSSKYSATSLTYPRSFVMAAASAAARGSRTPRCLSTSTRFSFINTVFLMKREASSYSINFLRYSSCRWHVRRTESP